MREATGNLWDFQDDDPESWVAITTNGHIRKDGTLTMGAGCALEAQKRFPQLPRLWGEMVSRAGNTVSPWPSFRLFTYPVKHNWWEYATLELIEPVRGDGKVLLRRSSTVLRLHAQPAVVHTVIKRDGPDATHRIQDRTFDSIVRTCVNL